MYHRLSAETLSPARGREVQQSSERSCPRASMSDKSCEKSTKLSIVKQAESLQLGMRLTSCWTLFMYSSKSVAAGPCTCTAERVLLLYMYKVQQEVIRSRVSNCFKNYTSKVAVSFSVIFDIYTSGFSISSSRQTR